MKLGKVLRNTAMASAVAVLALSAKPLYAANTSGDTVGAVGHASASVSSALSVSEVSAVKFGNLFITQSGAAAGDGSVTMTPAGTRTFTAGTDGVTLLNGMTRTDGQATATDTGSQSPGFYNISGANSGAVIYVSFSNIAGDLVDSNHPTNNVVLTGPGSSSPPTFTVDNFTFDLTDSTGNASTPSVTDTYAQGDYGTRVTLTGTSGTIRVGGTLHTVSGATYVDGPYQGTFNIMVSY